MNLKRYVIHGIARAGRTTAALLAVSLYCLAPLFCPAAPAAADAVTNGLDRIREIALSDPHEFTFAVFGDNRGSTDVFERLLSSVSEDPDIRFAVSTGDIVGAGSPERFNFFLSQVNRYLTKPLVYAVGNHEQFGGGGALYSSLIGSRDYSFVFGDASFIIADDTKPNGIDADGEALLAKELSAGDDSGETFVFMHVPLYDPVGTDIHHSLNPSAAARLIGLFKEHRVTHIFCSHIHGYYQGTWGGIPFTISGGAGAPLIGSDPAHYFYHYLKVHVAHGAVTIETVPVSDDSIKN